MNNSELNNIRQKFYEKVEDHLTKKSTISLEEVKKIIKNITMDAQIDTETSNKIMIYMGSYMVEKTIASTREILTYDGNHNISYKIFMDLETSEIYKVSIDKLEDFEKEYKVIYDKVDSYNLQMYLQNYNKRKEEFFKYALYNDQETAILKLTSKN